MQEYVHTRVQHFQSLFLDVQAVDFLDDEAALQELCTLIAPRLIPTPASVRLTDPHIEQSSMEVRIVGGILLDHARSRVLNKSVKVLFDIKQQ